MNLSCKLSKYSWRLALLLAVLLLSACSTVPPVVTVEPVSAIPGDRAPAPLVSQAPELPKIELDEEIVFRLLSANIALSRQRYAIATENYWYLAQLTRDPRLAEQAARTALFARFDDYALKAARLWVELLPENLPAREAVILAMVRNGDADAVQQHLEYLLERKSADQGSTFRFIAAILKQEQDLQTALRMMEKFVGRHDSSPDALYALGYLALHAKDLGKARAAVEHALALRPDWPNVMNLYVQIMRNQGKPYEAAVYLAGMLKKYPDAAKLRLSYARLLVDNQQFDEALQQYRLIIKASPKDVNVLFVTALLAMQMNQLDEAQTYLESILKLKARQDVVNYYLGQIAVFKKDIEAAVDYFKAVQHGEYYADAKLRLAVLLARQGKVETAREQLRSMRLRVPGKNVRAVLVEGNILIKANQLDTAMALYNEALAESPDDNKLLYARAMLADRSGDLSVLEQDLGHILDKDPDNVDALNALGYSLTEHSDRYQEAYGYIQRALELRPDNFAILDSMGWVLYRLGELTEAVDYLRRSYALKNDHEIAAHLGEVLWMLGNQQGARDVWEQALEHFPGDKQLLEVMERFIP